MKERVYSKGYRYPHDEPDALSVGAQYLPKDINASIFYEPTDRGLEKKIKEKLNYLRTLNKSTS